MLLQVIIIDTSCVWTVDPDNILDPNVSMAPDGSAGHLYQHKHNGSMAPDPGHLHDL